jgi:hypothetical protein
MEREGGREEERRGEEVSKKSACVCARKIKRERNKERKRKERERDTHS